jgi:hypothetical protein
MSTIRNDEESLLERVETLLKQNPKSQEDILRHLQTELVSLRAKSDTKTIETVFQEFGTAVGTDSKRNLTLNGAAANFDAEGWQTPLRETGILAFALEGLDPSNATASLQKQYLRVVGNCVADNGTKLAEPTDIDR